MKLAIAVACARNGVIGREGDLPWRLPDDLAHFREITWGHAVIMGRRTFETLPKPLPGRRNLVLSRDPHFAPAGVEVHRDLASALAAAQGDPEPFVVGGADVYREALPRAERLYLTRVHAEPEGDVHFPEPDWSEWKCVEERHHPADARHAHAFDLLTYVRAQAG